MTMQISLCSNGRVFVWLALRVVVFVGVLARVEHLRLNALCVRRVWYWLVLAIIHFCSRVSREKAKREYP